MSENLLRDGNRITVAGGQSSTDSTVVLPFLISSVTGRVLMDSALGTGTVTSVSVTTANGVSGSVATATTTPAITLTLGAITPSSVQVSELAASQILSTNGSKNLTSLDTATYPSLTELSYVKGVTSAIQTQINAKGAGTVTTVSVATANGFSGTVANATTTPAITIIAGAITPTTVNGNTFTTGTYTLTGQAGKTLTFNGSITLTGTDAQTYTFPTTTATIARTDAANTFTGVQSMTSPDVTTSITTATTSFTAWAGATTLLTIGGTGASASLFAPSTLDATSSTTGAIRTSGGISAAKALNVGTSITNAGAVIYTNNAIAASGNAATVPVTAKLNTVTNNSAATLTITMATASAVDGQMTIVRVLDATGVAQTITWVNTENSTVTSPTTSNGSTTLFLTVGLMYNNSTSKWRTIAVA